MASHEDLSFALGKLFEKIGELKVAAEQEKAAYLATFEKQLSELKVAAEQEKAAYLDTFEKQLSDMRNAVPLSRGGVDGDVRDNYLNVPFPGVFKTEIEKQVKQYCITCGYTVNPVGHALRCRPKAPDPRKPALELAAWIGDAALLVFARLHALREGVSRGEAHNEVERLVCNASLSAVSKLPEFGLLCTPDFVPTGGSDAKGGTSVEAAFAMCPRFRRFFATQYLPGVDCESFSSTVHEVLMEHGSVFSNFTPHSNVHGWCYRLFFTSECDEHKVECTDFYPALGQLAPFVESACYERYVFQVGEFLHVEAQPSRESSKLMSLRDVLEVYPPYYQVGGIPGTGTEVSGSVVLPDSELTELLSVGVDECSCRIHYGGGKPVPGEAKPLNGVFLRAYLGETGGCTASVETRINDKRFLAIAMKNDGGFRQYAQSGFYKTLYPFASSRGVSLEDVGPRYLYLGLVRPRFRFRVARLLGPTPLVADLLIMLNVSGAYKMAQYRFERQGDVVDVFRVSDKFSAMGQVYYRKLEEFNAEVSRLRIVS